MKHMFWFAVLAVFSGGALGAEPGINEMLKDAREMAVKPDKTGRVNPNAATKDSLFVQKMKRGVEVNLGKRDHEYKRNRNYRDRARLYYEIGRYKIALQYMLLACRNERDYRTRNGDNHQSLARIYTMMGQKELAKGAFDEASKRTFDEHRMRRLKDLQTWAKEFDGKKAEAEKLEAKAAQDPKDADSRWRLVELYDHAYPRPLDRFVLLMKFKEMFPEHKGVKEGNCDWELAEALWHFGMRNEALELAKVFAEKFPKHRRTTYGDATLRLGGWYHDTGQYASALKCYLEVQEKYQKHWVNRVNDEGRSWLGGRIYYAKKALQEGN